MEATIEPRAGTAGGLPGQDRRTYLGGTDVGAIAGLNPRRSRMSVYLAKIQGEEVEPNPYLEWGLRQEPTIAQAYADRIGRPLTRAPFMFGPAEFLGGTPDYLDTEGATLVEIKSVFTPRSKERWGAAGDDIPREHLAQVHYYMGLAMMERAAVAVLLPGPEFRVYEFAFDREFYDLLVEEGTRFWTDHILPQIPPPLDGSEEARRYVQAKYPRHVSSVRVASDEEVALAQLFREIRSAKVKAEEEETRLANEIKARIAEAEGIVGPGFKITWKKRKDGTKIDWAGVARDLAPVGIPAGIIEPRTTTTEGPRVFLPTFGEEA